MRRTPRLISAAVLIALGGALSGCGSTSGWDPTDLLDFLDTKKPLPGDRKKVFPEGVPGLEQGVPRNLYRGAAAEPAPEAVAPPVEEPKPAKAAKSKSRSKPAVATAPAAPAPDAEAPAVEEGAPVATPPAPKPAKQAKRRSITAPPADAEPQAATTAPAPAQQSSSPFPAPLPGGSFQR